MLVGDRRRRHQSLACRGQEEGWGGAESAALLSFSLLLVAAVVAAGRLHVGEEGRHAALDDHRETFQNQQN